MVTPAIAIVTSLSKVVTTAIAIVTSLNKVVTPAIAIVTSLGKVVTTAIAIVTSLSKVVTPAIATGAIAQDYGGKSGPGGKSSAKPAPEMGGEFAGADF